MMTLVRYSPWKGLSRYEDRLDRLFGDFLPRFTREEGLTGGWEPAVDVLENEKSFILKAEIPEVDQKDVHVNVEGNILTLTGERKREKDTKEGDYHRTERYYGSFCRSFALPDTVDREHIKATFKDGIMKLEMPKREETKPKEIKIEIEK